MRGHSGDRHTDKPQCREDHTHKRTDARRVARDPSVCPWTPRQELAGLCHSSLEPPAPQLQGQWVPPNPHQAFATICEQTAEVQGGGVAQEGGCVWARELTGP